MTTAHRGYRYAGIHAFAAAARVLTDAGMVQAAVVPGETPAEMWSFDVTVSSHDLLKAGVAAARLPGGTERHHRVVAAAGSRDEAALIAAQMASCQGVCTGVYDRI